ncbi:LacI family DNA-binding transcriptional regulator [Bacillus massiliigorillae]|uniref:LacI family DNA-binding transcriptional regulator n=1 Tax=Bacillus massiliigorillae TaxID=1243664 RepID=UPI0003AB39E7|nr:LacI family DNA-binding transcriptional regulator [Bacillus massiliigorillae]
MTVTIKDVAKLANVAPSTVSRVIANNSKISEKTKKRVREAMKELGYHPNFIARCLANKSTHIIGIVLPSTNSAYFQNPFFSMALQGISEGVHEHQYALQICAGKTNVEIYDDVVDMVQGGRVDGIILLYSRVNDRILQYLKERNFPFVSIGRPYDFSEEITYVDNNNSKAAKEATQYLIRLGHKRISFVGGHGEYIVTVERRKGYEEALQAAGLPLDTHLFLEDTIVRTDSSKAMAGLLALKYPPTAMIVTDDLLALKVLTVLKGLGVSVPDDMSIISFNNVLFSQYSTPPLTSVDVGIFDLGYQASICLIQQLNNSKEPMKRILLPYELVERQSCKQLK